LDSGAAPTCSGWVKAKDEAVAIDHIAGLGSAEVRRSGLSPEMGNSDVQEERGDQQRHSTEAESRTVLPWEGSGMDSDGCAQAFLRS
jgi:hypothetical protein